MNNERGNISPNFIEIERIIKEYDEFIKKKDVMFNKKYLKKKDIKNIKSGNGKLFEIYNELLALK